MIGVFDTLPILFVHEFVEALSRFDKRNRTIGLLLISAIVMALIASGSRFSLGNGKVIPNTTDTDQKVAWGLAVLLCSAAILVGIDPYITGEEPPVSSGPIEDVKITLLFDSNESSPETISPAGGTNHITKRQCPTDVNIEAEIRVTSETEQVTYRWVRDEIAVNREQISFRQRSIRTIQYNDTFGEGGNDESHTYKLEILEPVDDVYETDPRTVSVRCTNDSGG